MTFATELEYKIRATYPAIYVTAREDWRCIQEVKRVAERLKQKPHVWTVTGGWDKSGKQTDPLGAVRSLRSSVADALMQFNERVTSGEQVSGRGLGSIRRAVERFRELNFVGDDQVEAKLKELESLVPASAKKYEADGAAQAALQQGIASTLAVLVEDDVSRITGEYRRRILI